MVMYYQRPLPSDNSPYGVNDLREIHDFNTGMYNSLETRKVGGASIVGDS